MITVIIRGEPKNGKVIAHRENFPVMLESPKGRQALLCSIKGNDVPKKFALQSSLPRLATFLNYMRGDDNRIREIATKPGNFD